MLQLTLLRVYPICSRSTSSHPWLVLLPAFPRSRLRWAGLPWLPAHPALGHGFRTACCSRVDVVGIKREERKLGMACSATPQACCAALSWRAAASRLLRAVVAHAITGATTIHRKRPCQACTAQVGTFSMVTVKPMPRSWGLSSSQALLGEPRHAQKVHRGDGLMEALRYSLGMFYSWERLSV